MRVLSREATCLVIFPAAAFYQKQGTVHWWVRCHQWLCLPPLLPPWPPESLGGLSVRSHGSAPAATHPLDFLIFATPTGKAGADSLVTMRMWGDFCNPVKCAETVQLALNIQCFYVILQSVFHNSAEKLSESPVGTLKYFSINPFSLTLSKWCMCSTY